jgi:tetratricopeptide (TPR) repeat protein
MPITSSLQEHQQFCGKEAHYEAWTNHNTCLEHREWWRDARLVSAFLVLTGIAIGASVSAYFFNHDDGQALWGLDRQSILPVGSNDSKTALWTKLRRQGLQQVNAGNLKAGITLLKKAEKISSIPAKAHAELLNDLAVAEHQAGNSVDSIIYFNRAVQLDPAMRAAQNNLILARRLESIETWK